MMISTVLAIKFTRFYCLTCWNWFKEGLIKVNCMFKVTEYKSKVTLKWLKSDQIKHLIHKVPEVHKFRSKSKLYNHVICSKNQRKCNCITKWPWYRSSSLPWFYMSSWASVWKLARSIGPDSKQVLITIF